jgi:hypothetical protein
LPGSAFDLRKVRDLVNGIAEARQQLRRRARFALSGSLTVTLSKNTSIGARSEANAAIAAVKSSASTAALAVGSASSRAATSAFSSSGEASGCALP